MWYLFEKTKRHYKKLSEPGLYKDSLYYKRRLRQKNHDKIVSSVNVIILFMVFGQFFKIFLTMTNTSSDYAFINTRNNVTLPYSVEGKTIQLSRRNRVYVSLTKNNEIMIKGLTVNWKDYSSAIKKYFERNGRLRILYIIDKECQMANVYQLMKLAQHSYVENELKYTLGSHGIFLVTQKRYKSVH